MSKKNSNVIVTSKNDVWYDGTKIASFEDKTSANSFGKSFGDAVNEDVHIQSSRNTSTTKKGQFIK
ncbi:hypothetical protein [Mycoplasma marinum]|uniref:Uncharacterized protein n=1 Tax=Mycoplasma marinum TaxID=1937190 RepID=A0A4R0XLD8_9MOLU|nr:hypothetical protein [Mycoplasma marinum]TCG10242.1 hypothetical protein C4B24_05100 [Mycoplasma marinum]